MKLVQTNLFKRDVERMQKRGKDLTKLKKFIFILRNSLDYKAKYKVRPLKGNRNGYMDAHLEPDWILIYKVHKSYLLLARTGSHSDLF
jgi:mRNA interferase YafQ